MIELSAGLTDCLGLITISTAKPFEGGPLPSFISKLELWLGASEMKGATVVINQGAGDFFYEKSDELYRELITALNRAPIPLSAAVESDCLDTDLELALACHFQFFNRASRIGFSRKGGHLILAESLGGRLSASGRGCAQSILRERRTLTAADAISSGLGTGLADTNKTRQAAYEFLRTLTIARSSELVRAVICSAKNSLTLPRIDALEKESWQFHQLARRPNMNDQVAAPHSV